MGVIPPESVPFLLTRPGIVEACAETGLTPDELRRACKVAGLPCPSYVDVTPEIVAAILEDRLANPTGVSRRFGIRMGIARDIVLGVHRGVPKSHRGRKDLPMSWVAATYRMEGSGGYLGRLIRQGKLRGEVTENRVPVCHRGRMAAIHDEAIRLGLHLERTDGDVAALAAKAEVSYLDVLRALTGDYTNTERAPSMGPPPISEVVVIETVDKLPDDDLESLAIRYESWVYETLDRWLEFDEWYLSGEAWAMTGDRRFPRTTSATFAEYGDGRHRVDDRGVVYSGKCVMTPRIVGGLSTVKIYGDWVPVEEVSCRAWHGEAPEGRKLVVHANGRLRDNRPQNIGWGNSVDVEAMR